MSLSITTGLLLLLALGILTVLTVPPLPLSQTHTNLHAAPSSTGILLHSPSTAISLRIQVYNPQLTHRPILPPHTLPARRNSHVRGGPRIQRRITYQDYVG